MPTMKRTFFLKLLLAALVVSALPITVRAADGGKQPVFLMCPSNKKYSAWSVYVTVDPANPAKLTGLGLDKMKGQNISDSGGYDAVLKAQQDPNTAVENLGTLSV